MIILKWIIKHFHRYKERKPWDFCWRIALEATLIGGIVYFLFGLNILDRLPPSYTPKYVLLLLDTIITTPAFETLLFQVVPVFIARLCKANDQIQIVASVVPFFLVHLLSHGLEIGISAGIVGGFYLAFSYVHWRSKSRWLAFVITWAVHIFHNGLITLLAIII